MQSKKRFAGRMHITKTTDNSIIKHLEEKLKMEILQHLKKREGEEGRRDVNEINLDDDYTSEVESRYVNK